MTRNLRRTPATPGLRQTVGTAADASRAATPARTARQRIGRDSLADHQSDTPANNSTGVPTTPTAAGDPYDDSDHKEERGAGMQWLDELGS
jgi:hypothetical protein